MTRRRRIFLGVVVASMLVLLFLRVAAAIRDPAAPVTVDLAFTRAPEQTWNETAGLVTDPRAGHRPRRSFAQHLPTAPLAAPDRVAAIERSTCALGLVRGSELGAEIPGPQVLVLGDDQTMGSVPAAANWTTLLEVALRARGKDLATSTVLNAGCDDYGLMHYVLRGPELVARYAPEVVVVAVATGDDVVALDDARLPHIDDAAFPAGPAHLPAADPIGLGPRARSLCPDHPDLARRGLAQAAYRDSVDGRGPILGRKARQALLWLLELAPRGRLLVALIPPADLAQPAATAALCSAAGRELIERGVQARAHRDLVQLCVELGVAHVDALPLLEAAAADDVYQTDGRLGPAGHRLIAAALLDRVARIATLR